MELIMKESTIYFSNVTDLDCALCRNQFVIGRTFRVAVSVTGRVEDEEQVVIDFSAAKKMLKQFIDDGDIGLDHKMIMFTEDYPNVVDEYDFGSAFIETDYFQLELPNDAYKLIEGDSTLTSIEEYLSTMLTEQMSKHYGFEVKCGVLLNETPILSVFENNFPNNFDFLDSVQAEFTYVHGLKNSSSYGCQNIAHGHSSYILLQSKKELSQQVKDHLRKFMWDMTSSPIVFTTLENCTLDDSGAYYIQYESKSRGEFKMLVKPETTTKQFKVIMLDAPDTTVENLVDYMVNCLREHWDPKLGVLEDHIETVYVSEGLSKGALVKL